MHLFLLALVFGIFLHDGAMAELEAGGLSGGQMPQVTYGLIELVLVTLLPKLVLGLAYAAICTLTVRRLGRPGINAHRAIRRLDWISAAVRLVLLGLYGVDLMLGQLQAMRAWLGDLVLVDELLLLLPTLAVLVWMWTAYYPIDRRLREAATIRLLDRGEPIPPLWTRWQYILNQLRHQMAIVLLPLMLLLGWMDLLSMAQARQWLAMPEVAWIALQLTGVASVMLLAPLMIRHVWDTSPLPDGPLRTRLVAMCKRHGVGVRELLLWHTFGGMINAAVMGFVGPVRYILLTDALLDRLPLPQVEAVMAHELAHVRRHHLFWLLLAAGSLGVSLELVARLTLDVMWPAMPASPPPDEGPILVMASVVDPLLALMTDPRSLLLLAIGPAAAVWVLAFGWVSRRFERQADTFAVQHLTLERPDPQLDPQGQRVIDALSALTMIHALQQVAVLNHIDPAKPSWRHGSIAWRQDYLRSLVGLPVETPTIDRVVRRINILSLILAITVAAVMVVYSRPW